MILTLSFSVILLPAILLCMVALLVCTCRMGGFSQNPKMLLVPFPPGPEPQKVVVVGVNANIHVHVKHDPKRTNHKYLAPASGQRAEVCVVGGEIKDGDVLPLTAAHIDALNVGLAASKQDGSNLKEVLLPFLTSHPNWPAGISDGDQRGIILRVPFGVDSASSLEEWDANGVVFTVS